MKKFTCKLLLSLMLFSLFNPLLCWADGEKYPAPGHYQLEAELTGGSGRTSVSSPLYLEIGEQDICASIQLSSSNYTWAKVGDTRYDAQNIGGFSTFDIPLQYAEDLDFEAETVAMSKPHVITYHLELDWSTLQPSEAESAQDFYTKKPNEAKKDEKYQITFASEDLGNGWKVQKEMDLHYAERFKVSYFKGGYKLIRLADQSRFLVVPQDKKIPQDIDSDIHIIQQPLKDVYLASSSVMCFFIEMDALDALAFSSFQKKDWQLAEAKEAMSEGRLKFAGKYSAPDYELLTAQNASLAIESTMIRHSPESAEMLEHLGIPVFMDQSSHESHPLGRSEWMRCYAAILNKEELAAQSLEEQEKLLEQVNPKLKNPPTVALFYFNSRGDAVVRNVHDYMVKMLELAGGKYAFSSLDKTSTGMVNMRLENESFYTSAKAADIFIYNSTIVGEVEKREDLLALNPLLADCKAYKENKVWCLRQGFYQDATSHGRFVYELNQIFSTDVADWPSLDLEYLYLMK